MRQLYGSHVNCMHFTVAYVCVREGGVGGRRARDAREPRFLGNDVGVVVALGAPSRFAIARGGRTRGDSERGRTHW